jgi:3',5'-cyclic-AMP phosphodiesterase
MIRIHGLSIDAPARDDRMTFRIAHVSDAHLSAEKPFFLANFDRVSADIAGRGVDLVLDTGDLSLDGADVVEDLEAARARHEAHGLPWRAIPGNHDIGDNVAVAKKQPFDEARRERWLSVFGADHFVMDVPGWCILGVNALMLGSGIEAERGQEETIAAAVETLGDRALFLAIHKPLFERDWTDGETNHRFVPPAARARLRALLGDARPRVVACGHVHQFRDRRVGETRHVWAPGTSFILGPEYQPLFGQRTVGYVLHALEPDGTHRSRLVPPHGMVINDLVAIPEAYGDLTKAMPRLAEPAAA